MSGATDGSEAAIDRGEEPPMIENWTYNPEVPSLHGRFSNDWRFEIKPIDGETYYNLHVPMDELDEWKDGAQIEDWSFTPFGTVVDDLQSALMSAETLSDLADADTIVVQEYGSMFEMLEREDL